MGKYLPSYLSIYNYEARVGLVIFNVLTPIFSFSLVYNMHCELDAAILWAPLYFLLVAIISHANFLAFWLGGTKEEKALSLLLFWHMVVPAVVFFLIY